MNIGVFLAWPVRIVLLLGIMYIATMKKPFLIFDNTWASGSFNIQAVILFAGGLFLLFKGSRKFGKRLNTKVTMRPKL